MQLSIVRTLTLRAWAACVFESATGRFTSESLAGGVAGSRPGRMQPLDFLPHGSPDCFEKRFRELIQGKDLAVVVEFNNKFYRRESRWGADKKHTSCFGRRKASWRDSAPRMFPSLYRTALSESGSPALFWSEGTIVADEDLKGMPERRSS